MFKDKLKELRIKNNLTQDDMAKKLYVTRNAISKWENGKGYPNIESLKTISKQFNISLDELINEQDATLITLENSKNLKKQQNILLSIGLFIIYALTGILIPTLLFKYDPTSVMVYFIFIRPLTIIIIALICPLLIKKPSYSLISSALAIIPIFLYFDNTKISGSSLYELVYYIIFVGIYFLIRFIITLNYKRKTLIILKWILFGINVSLLVLFIILNIINLINYNNYITSFPWYTYLIYSGLIFILPFILTLLLFLYFNYRLKELDK